MRAQIYEDAGNRRRRPGVPPRMSQINDADAGASEMNGSDGPSDPGGLDGSDGSGAACADCATPNGCADHERFACVTCGRQTAWDDASDADPDECAGCGAQRARIDERIAGGDASPTASIAAHDGAGGAPAVQVDGLAVPAPLLSPEAAERLADDLQLAADAARQAARDGYRGSAVVLGLEVGAEAPVDHESDEWIAAADAAEHVVVLPAIRA